MGLGIISSSECTCTFFSAWLTSDFQTSDMIPWPWSDWLPEQLYLCKIIKETDTWRFCSINPWPIEGNPGWCPACMGTEKNIKYECELNVTVGHIVPPPGGPPKTVPQWVWKILRELLKNLRIPLDFEGDLPPLCTGCPECHGEFPDPPPPDNSCGDF